MIVFMTLSFALLVDYIFGEASRFHPLVLFGNIAHKVEHKFNCGNSKWQFIFGVLAWCILVLPIPILYLLLIPVLPSFILILFNVYIVYWAVALNSLSHHGMQIYRPLHENNLSKAQHFCSYIVSRNTKGLNATQVSRATTESMLENGHDGVTATLIYFVIGGAPLVIMHRLSNTLDAMWGYRNPQFNYFGKFSAWMDDFLGFVSGKITCILFAIIGLSNGTAKQALINAYYQGSKYKSHNGGWVMACGATVINVSLGGTAYYFGKKVTSVQLGTGSVVQEKHIKRSLSLVKKAVLLWLLLVLIAF